MAFVLVFIISLACYRNIGLREAYRLPVEKEMAAESIQTFRWLR